MTTFQKIIKIFAIFLGVFIIVSIINVTLLTLGIISDVDLIKNTDNNKEFNEIYIDINNIEIDIDSADITIKKGETLSVEGENLSSNFKSEKKNNKLKIEEEKKFWKTNTASKITIYIPKTENINELSIDAGAGTINITDLSINELKISQGAGTLTIENVTSTKTNIDGGAGEMIVKESVLNNLDLDSGVGSVDIEAKVTGTSEIDCGVGEINLKLMGTKEDYTLLLQKGIGSIKVENNDQKNDTTYGAGSNKIKIDGGVGEIKVDFIKSNIIDDMLIN